jgi:hypothetical protein
MIFGTGGKSPFMPSRTHLFVPPVFRVDRMRKRFTGMTLAVAAASLVLSSSAGAALIGIYRNAMETKSQRSEVLKLSGASCNRDSSKSDHVLKIVVGKRTKECSYRTPVVGRDLEVSATMRLLSSTPKQLQRKDFLAVNLRAGGGARYQLAVYPLQRKAQLRKVLPGGKIKYFHIAKNLKTVRGIDGANDLRLHAFNSTTGPEKGSCQLLAFVGGEKVAEATDSAAGELKGRASGFSVGAATNAKGTVASVDDVLVKVPNPF